MKNPVSYGQQIPYAISEIPDDLPRLDDLLAVVCTGTGIGLVAFMTGHYLQKQDLHYVDVGEISSLSMLSDPIVDENTGYFESPGIKLKLTTDGKTPLLLAFGPRQPASWEAHFVSTALFDAMKRLSDNVLMLSVGGFGVGSKEKMPKIVGRPNGAEADKFMARNKIAKIDDIQSVEGIAKILNAGQGFQAALPMLAMKRGIPSVFFLGTALMPNHVGVRLDKKAARQVMAKISDIAGVGLDYKLIDAEMKKVSSDETSEEGDQQRAIYELARRFSQGQSTENPNTDMYI